MITNVYLQLYRSFCSLDVHQRALGVRTPPLVLPPKLIMHCIVWIVNQERSEFVHEILADAVASTIYDV